MAKQVTIKLVDQAEVLYPSETKQSELNALDARKPQTTRSSRDPPLMGCGLKKANESSMAVDKLRLIEPTILSSAYTTEFHSGFKTAEQIGGRRHTVPDKEITNPYFISKIESDKSVENL